MDVSQERRLLTSTGIPIIELKWSNLYNANPFTWKDGICVDRLCTVMWLKPGEDWIGLHLFNDDTSFRTYYRLWPYEDTLGQNYKQCSRKMNRNPLLSWPAYWIWNREPLATVWPCQQLQCIGTATSTAPALGIDGRWTRPGGSNQLMRPVGTSLNSLAPGRCGNHF